PRALPGRGVALRSAIPLAAISLIEREHMAPSINAQAAILDALGTTLTGFFMDLPSRLPYTPFYAANDLVEIGKPQAISYRMIGMNHPNRQLLMLHETYAEGADTGEAFTHPAQEAGMVTRGAIELTVGEETRVLRAGDGYYFDSRIAHRFRNVAPGTSEILSAVTPPTY
ncbi:MAG TPA: cupin domain-containing protein, partial [Aestuariivirga sp.]|nr:cupin domain-containing protein [Aestuariivirga sp.]